MDVAFDFKLDYEYFDDTDMRVATKAEAKWREEIERRQERQFRRLMDKLIVRSGITRLMAWL